MSASNVLRADFHKTRFCDHVTAELQAVPACVSAISRTTTGQATLVHQMMG